MHLFKAAHAVYTTMIELREQPRSKDLQELNRVLDAMETHGHLAPCDSAGYHKSYRQLAEFTRTHVQAEILHRLPKPPEWAPDFPDAKRLDKHLPKLMEYAILMMDSTPASLSVNGTPIDSTMTLLPPEIIRQFRDAVEALDQALYHEERPATQHELRRLNEILFDFEAVGIFDPPRDPKYQKAMTQFNEFMRAAIVAHVQQNLPNPPYWAQAYPDPKRLRKHMNALKDLAGELSGTTA